MAKENKYTYDFLLFENYIGAVHHYTDIPIIARMLKMAGYTVAIADYFEENKYCKNDEFDILTFNCKVKKPDNQWRYKPRNKIIKQLYYWLFLYRQHKYAACFMNQIKGLAKNYYIGSYNLSMSSVFFSHSENKCNYFLWGLRSSRITNFKSHFLKNPIAGYKAIKLRRLFHKKNNFNFFVSNELIKNEFIELGIAPVKLVVRPERIINCLHPQNSDLLSDTFSFLIIGLLREDKRVELAIKSFSKVNNEIDAKLTIAGRTSEDYEKEISKCSTGIKNVKRINKYLDYSEFNALIEKSHFVVLCDKQQPSLITNGTMMEALMLNRPIIAPNYLPYSDYIVKYKIGLLFNPDDENSLSETMLEAKNMGVQYFLPNILEFQKTLLIENCGKQFISELSKSLDN